MIGDKQFVGLVKIYDKEIFINTNNGEGYDQLIKLIDRMVKYIAGKFKFQGYDLEDNKQQIYIYILEAIRYFDPSKKMKLSTFLQMIAKRKMINSLRFDRLGMKNATTLKINNYDVICKCGHINSISCDVDDDCSTTKCDQCMEFLIEAKKVPTNFNELYLDDIFSNVDENNMCESKDIYGINKYLSEDDIISHIDISELINKINDDNTKTIINNIYKKDINILSTSKELNINHGTANFKTRSLSKNNLIKEVFSQE